MSKRQPPYDYDEEDSGEPTGEHDLSELHDDLSADEDYQDEPHSAG